MEKSGTASQVTQRSGPTASPWPAVYHAPDPRKREGSRRRSKKGKTEGGRLAAQGGRGQEAGNRRTGTTSLPGGRKSLPLPGPVRVVRVLRVRVRVVSGSSQGCPRAAPKHMHEGNTGTTCVYRAVRRCVCRDWGGRVKNAWTILTVCSESSRGWRIHGAVSSWLEKRRQELTVQDGAEDALLRRGAVTRTPTARL